MSPLSDAIDDLARRGAERGVDLRPRLARVEQRLRDAVDVDLPVLAESSHHLVDAGGKRFRPMLVLLTGSLGGDPDDEDDALVEAGVVVELVHLATLFHDDVIDGAETRRGTVAAHVRWSNTTAILTGDHLLARASELAADLGVEVTRIMARTIAALCAGQIREVQGSRQAQEHGMAPVEPDRSHYLAVITDKTASLIASACRLGALLSGLSGEAVEAMTAYGHHLGMSFQIADDVLDLASDPGESGKEAGTDLKEGVRTLPVLHALEADGPDSTLARLLVEASDDAVDQALELLRGHPALELARADARQEAAAARSALCDLDGSATAEVVREGLAELADYAATRVG